MVIRLSNTQIADFLIACLRGKVMDFIEQMGGKIELSFRFLLECNPLARLISEGKLHLSIEDRLLSDWGDFVQLTREAADEFLITISLAEN